MNTVLSQMVAMCASVITVSHALADATPAYRMERLSDGARSLVLVEGDTGVSPAAGDRAYDNWRGPSFSPPGVSRYRSSIGFNGNELGDDLILNSWQPSIVNDLGFTIYNASTTDTMTAYWLRIRFYDSQFNLIGIDEASYSGATIAPGGGAKVYSDDGFFAGYGFQTRSSMYM
ncbi:MAG: hypothetical protein KGS45_03695 [Planctomycetes bacterium]|nr:hypothetical protein [Planctomycetota bacterium]